MHNPRVAEIAKATSTKGHPEGYSPITDPKVDESEENKGEAEGGTPIVANV